ncbi:type IV pilin protein [Thermodesulfobacteriota bacterium B35]
MGASIRRMQKITNREAGFTLVELMIVVAIIGILAAIAVPQFLSYRLRSYNTAAKAVVHNLKADEANLNSELGVYGHTEAAASTLAAADATAPGAPNTAVGAAADSSVVPALGSAATAGVAGARLVGTTTQATPRTLAIGVAIGANMIAQATDINDASNNSTYTLFARHMKGDTAYAIDSDLDNAMFSVSNPAWPNTAGLGATPVNAGANTGGAATSVGDDIGGQAGGGVPTANWAQM